MPPRLPLRGVSQLLECLLSLLGLCFELDLLLLRGVEFIAAVGRDLFEPFDLGLLLIHVLLLLVELSSVLALDFFQLHLIGLGLLNLTLHLANQFLRIHQLFVDLPKKQTTLCGLEQCPPKAELPVGPLA